LDELALQGASALDDIPEISLDTPAEHPRFLGIITVDEVVVRQNKEGGQFKRWQYGVRPVDYKIGGKTGAWTRDYPISKVEGSIMLQVRDSLKKVFGVLKNEDGSTVTLGKGQLIGLVAMFERRLGKAFGREYDGAVFAVEPATPEQIEKALALEPYVPAAPITDAAETVTPAASTNGHYQLTDEEQKALLVVYQGRNDVQAAKFAMNERKEEYGHLRDLIVNGSGVTALLQAGLITRLPDGRYASAELA
jgi:hypothetical protein